MKVDIYVTGKGNKHVARYLSCVLGVEYGDTDGMNIFVLKGADSKRIPKKVFGSPIIKKLEIRNAEGPERGEIIWPPEGFVYA